MVLPSLRGLLGAHWTKRHFGEEDCETCTLVGASGYSKIIYGKDTCEKMSKDVNLTYED